ncbi:MAG: T9SS type A sorting domain-containing protein [Ignavibacteria bacterium]|nr:T9SS type A sorting domain-containing protein [Ignavibacteria bacterium]
MHAKLLLLFLFTIFLVPEQFLISQQIKFAVIGDYGDDNLNEAAVANFVNGWGVNFIVTVGDNYYGAEDGNYIESWNAIDNEVGQYYYEWIGDYQGSYNSSFINLINKNDSWKYSVDESDNNWETVAYNDDGWLTGNGIFGAEGNLTISTPLSPMINSFFFRKTFMVTNISEVTSLIVDLLYDDSIFVFINGVEVYQAGGLSGSPPAWDITGAAFHEATQYEAQNLTSMISNFNLIEGTNTIAIGVWNKNTSSSDIVFDARLRISHSTGTGSSTNKFFPVLGNHDFFHEDSSKVYTDYFTLPGNERYYDFEWGDKLHFFMLSNYGVGIPEYNGDWPRYGNNGEPDGVESNSVQADWFYQQINNCVQHHPAHWRIVVMHHAPYSSGTHGSTSSAQWDYKARGAHIVLTAHDHVYERLIVGGLTYIVNGLGGRSIGSSGNPITGSVTQFNGNFGAMFFETIGETQLKGQFIDIDGVVQDDFTLENTGLPVELVFFTGSINGNNVELRWRTETEVNNYGFYIERSSENSDWLVLGFVEGNGNSNSPKYYNFDDTDIRQSGKYYYRLKQIDNDGTIEYSNVVTVTVGVPVLFALSQNYPNPFNPETRIDFTVAEQRNVSLRVYNMLGEMVQELLNEVKPPGSYSVTFDASNLSSGIYIYRLETSDFIDLRKMTLLK